MPDDPTPDDMRSIWQNQTKETSTVSLELIRYKAEKLERMMHHQVVGAYILGLGILPISLLLFWQVHEVFIRMGAAVLAFWGVSLVYWTCKGGWPGRFAPEAVLAVSLEFYRREIERQRFYSRVSGKLLWPVLLSAVLFMTQAVVGTARNRGGLIEITAWLAWIFFMLAMSRRKHQAEIEELESLQKPKHVNPPPTIPWE